MARRFSAKRWKPRGKKVPKALAQFVDQVLQHMEEDDTALEGGIYYFNGELLTYVSVFSKERIKVPNEQEEYVV